MNEELKGNKLTKAFVHSQDSSNSDWEEVPSNPNKHMIKSLTPSTDQLASLNLQPG